MSHLVPCPSCNRHVLTAEMVCPFCAITLPPELRAAPPPPPVRTRLGRAALLAAGATLMGAAACSDGDGTGNGDGATDRGAVSDAASEGAITGSGGSGGAPGNDAAAAGGSGGGAASDAASEDRGAVALYGIPAPQDGGVPIYGTPSPNNVKT